MRQPIGSVRSDGEARRGAGIGTNRTEYGMILGVQDGAVGQYLNVDHVDLDAVRARWAR